MRKFTSAHAKNHFGELIDAARAAPVAITKHDRTVVVIVATEEYERMSRRRTESRQTPKSYMGKSRLKPSMSAGESSSRNISREEGRD
jgi:prevent-host-death family protein